MSNYYYDYDFKIPIESLQNWSFEEYQAYEESFNDLIPGKNKITSSTFETRHFYIFKIFKDLEQLFFSKVGEYVTGEGVFIEINTLTYETAESYRIRKKYDSSIRSWVKPEIQFKDEFLASYCIHELEKGMVTILSDFKVNIGLPSILGHNYKYASNFIIPDAKEKIDRLTNMNNVNIEQEVNKIILDNLIFSRTLKHINSTNMRVKMDGKYIISDEDGIHKPHVKILYLFYITKIHLLRYRKSIQRMENVIEDIKDKSGKDSKYTRTKEYKNTMHEIENLLIILESVITNIVMHFCLIKSNLNYCTISTFQKDLK